MTACLGENTVTDLVDALVAPARRAVIEAHTATCESCRRLISELVRRTGDSMATGTIPAELAATVRNRRAVGTGTLVGRYIVRERIGVGAMGTVFSAFDPELDRTIALKLLHPGSVEQRDRIQSEARALAKLSHPNVVAAYDVGEFDGDLFLAMELVDGINLRAWAATAHTSAEVLEVYRQAGRGLAAAHAGKLIHRDFKPDNALRGNDGRVRIVDFGLAAGMDGGTELVGTPAYMAPEQFEAGGADELSDQFSFCVAVYEALNGERPFTVNLIEDVRRGIRKPSVKLADVTPVVQAALERGLHADPAKRHASMEALLGELARGQPRRRGRNAIVAGGIAVLAGGGIVVASLLGSSRSATPRCDDARDAFAHVWNPTREAAIHARFVAASVTTPAIGEDIWQTATRGVRGFGDRWIPARAESCTAAHSRTATAEDARRLECLDRSLAEVDALATAFGAVDARSIARVPAAVERLPSLAACADPIALVATAPLPTDAAVAPAASRDARAVATPTFGHGGFAHGDAAVAVASADAAIGAWRPDAAVAAYAAHEIARAELPALRAAINELDFTGLSFTGSNLDGDLAQLQTDLAAVDATDHYKRGVMLEALGAGERRRADCAAAVAQFNAALAELGTFNHANPTDNRVWAWWGRSNFGIALCELQAGHGLAALPILQQANSTIGYSGGGDDARAETHAAMGMTRYLTGDVVGSEIEFRLVEETHDTHARGVLETWLKAANVATP